MRWAVPKRINLCSAPRRAVRDCAAAHADCTSWRQGARLARAISAVPTYSRTPSFPLLISSPSLLLAHPSARTKASACLATRQLCIFIFTSCRLHSQRPCQNCMSGLRPSESRGMLLHAHHAISLHPRCTSTAWLWSCMCNRMRQAGQALGVL